MRKNGSNDVVGFSDADWVGSVTENQPPAFVPL
jgi:hypothetical protein